MLLAFGACVDHAPSWADFIANDMTAGTGTSSDGGAAATTGPASTLDEPTPATGDPEGTTDAASSGDASSAASDAGSTAGGAELVPPRILAVDVPTKVHLAGPVPVTVMTEGASLVRATLDGAELELFTDQGGGVWTGAAPCFGAVDNGAHVLEVTATLGPLSHAWPPVMFEVAAPAPGDLAWARLGPSGSTSRRVVVTPEGDAIEVGSLVVDGAPRPSIRKRRGKDGTEVWAEGTIVLDSREGAVDAVALTPGGQIWVAMNVRQADSKWRPRIVLLDAEGHATGVEMPTDAGTTVRGIASDAAGGCIAVGFGSSGYGDTDIKIWRMNAEGVAVVSAKGWDHAPNGQLNLHGFDDLAFDVVIKDGVAWVAGASKGKHDEWWFETRGILVPLDLETGARLDPVVVQEAYGGWRQGMYLGAAAHPDGVVVVGYGAMTDEASQRIELALYDAGGARLWWSPEAAVDVAYGTGVAVSAHGGVIASGVVMDGGTLRGVVLGRKGLTYELEFSSGLDPSAVYGVALDPWDQVFAVGELTAAGVRYARAAFVRQ
ncbi:hypothetical protein [Nannocystis bainbridge]|uniref:Uncharacterized protein n=1 Tax=Nannocystis bainbridge TaxID=2995303 RepID=A0ABT5DRF5_9BACT|nr:hypothetical protein [Nannocystis bainbridge]MDC0716230.1 hypothetical protein [Nannocystis bainbridge]